MLPANAAADFNVCFSLLSISFRFSYAAADVICAQVRSHNIIDTGKSGRPSGFIHTYPYNKHESFRKQIKKQHRSLCLVSCGFLRTRNTHLYNNNIYAYNNIIIHTEPEALI